MASGAQHDLPGHQAEVLALATSANMLFSAGKDQSIRAWQFDPASSTFRPSVSPRTTCFPFLLIQTAFPAVESPPWQHGKHCSPWSTRARWT